jgi:co-chaperonin GroES (HSP10)
MRLVKPSRNRVLLRQLDIKETEQTTIVVPEHLQERPQVYQVCGIGDLFDYKNRKVDPTFAVNDLVIIDGTNSVKKTIGGVEYTILPFENVLMVVSFSEPSAAESECQSLHAAQPSPERV